MHYYDSAAFESPLYGILVESLKNVVVYSSGGNGGGGGGGGGGGCGGGGGGGGAMFICRKFG
jgi:hypothetical protein